VRKGQGRFVNRLFSRKDARAQSFFLAREHFILKQKTWVG